MSPDSARVGEALVRFDDLVARLRKDCPWDAEQTHASLRRHLLEETYEVLDAINDVDAGAANGYPDLREELGDLLFQVFFHSRLATEAGQFDLADVATDVHDKLRDRHPHVFGASKTSQAAGVDADEVLESTEQVLSNWEQLKKAEKGRSSVMDGMPSSLPALLLAAKTLKKAENVGHGFASEADARHAVSEALVAMGAEGDAPSDEAVGSLLLAVVGVARHHDIDAEMALRAATVGVQTEVRAAEAEHPSS